MGWNDQETTATIDTRNYANMVLSFGPEGFSETDYRNATGSKADNTIAYTCLVAHTVSSMNTYTVYLKQLNAARSDGNASAWAVAKATLDFYLAGGYDGGTTNMQAYAQALSAADVPYEYGDAIPDLISSLGRVNSSTSRMTLQEYGAQIREGIRNNSASQLNQANKIYQQGINRDLKNKRDITRKQN